MYLRLSQACKQRLLPPARALGPELCPIIVQKVILTQCNGDQEDVYVRDANTLPGGTV